MARIIRVVMLIVLFSVGAGMSCRRQGASTTQSAQSMQEVHTPESSAAWTGHPGNLLEWGQGPGLIYGTLSVPGTKKEQLVCWQWRNGTLEEAPVIELPESVLVVPGIQNVCGIQANMYKMGGWPFVLMNMVSHTIFFEWYPPPGWNIRRAGVNRRGIYVLFLRESPNSSQYDFQSPRCAVVLMPPEQKNTREVAELRGRGFAGTVRCVTVSDDENFIAVGGWNNGIAMVDCREGKVIWSKRPKDEISTTKVLFGPDSKILYATGSAGCVYEIDVLTGAILNRRWASPTGAVMTGHRASAMDFSQDGTWLAVGTGPEGDVYCWNLKTGGIPLVLHHGLGTINIVSISPDSKKIATVGGGCLKTWSLEPGTSSQPADEGGQ